MSIAVNNRVFLRYVLTTLSTAHNTVEFNVDAKSAGWELFFGRVYDCAVRLDTPPVRLLFPHMAVVVSSYKT